MERKRIHPEGPEFSRIITGVWRWHALSANDTEALINTSLENGITTFDHADIYGNYSCEELFGKAIENRSSLRNTIQLVTKCGIKLLSDKRPEHQIKHYDTSKEHIIWSVENSLQNLKTDYLDLLLLHRPDPLMNPAEVAEAFSMLKQSGKVLFFGVSNFTPTQVELLASYLRDPLVTNQIEISLFNHQLLFDGTVDTLMKHQISPMAWSPLGGGKFFADSEIQKQLETFAQRYTCSISQLLLAWLLRHPSGIFPILGTTNTNRLTEGAKALTVQLDKQDWFAMLKLVTGRDVA
ncbi:MAG: aldo/keto reductase [Cyclobacteriaceae bacterium]|nr:aldo/keto reductase [Cyclobacteriaceae bacterium]UYN86730.1 MAG: aldo/keto reductase [Cyclobacteriaceae bacterium]